MQRDCMRGDLGLSPSSPVNFPWHMVQGSLPLGLSLPIYKMIRRYSMLCNPYPAPLLCDSVILNTGKDFP